MSNTKKLMMVVGCMLWSGVAVADGVPDSVEELVKWGERLWDYDDTAKTWKTDWGIDECLAAIDGVAAAGVADTLEVEVKFATPEFKAGKVTVAQLKATCHHAQRYAAVKYLAMWFKTDFKPWTDEEAGGHCYAALEKLKPLMPLDARLPYEGITAEDPATGKPLTITFQEGVDRFCKPLMAAQLAWEEPYRAALKADKLAIVLEQGAGFYIKGKVQTEDPKTLAKAKTWYREVEYPDNRCLDGTTVHMVYKYQFDAKHALVKEDTWERCGPEKKSKFK